MISSFSIIVSRPEASVTGDGPMLWISFRRTLVLLVRVVKVGVQGDPITIKVHYDSG